MIKKDPKTIIKIKIMMKKTITIRTIIVKTIIIKMKIINRIIERMKKMIMEMEMKKRMEKKNQELFLLLIHRNLKINYNVQRFLLLYRIIE